MAENERWGGRVQRQKARYFARKVPKMSQHVQATPKGWWKTQ